MKQAERRRKIKKDWPRKGKIKKIEKMSESKVKTVNKMKT